MKVVFIEGCHGTGKSSVISLLQKKGFLVGREDFLLEDVTPFDKQGVLAEFLWMAKKIETVVKHIKIAQAQSPGVDTLFFDRSIVSAIFYTKNGDGGCFEDLISKLIESVETSMSVKCYHVCFTCGLKELTNRISKRLSNTNIGNIRKQLKELDKDHIMKTVTLYSNYSWDLVIDTTLSTPTTTCAKLIDHFKFGLTPSTKELSNN